MVGELSVIWFKWFVNHFVSQAKSKKMMKPAFFLITLSDNC